MFIRKTATRNNATNEPYFTFRLVASERTAQQVRQITLLNLGRHFDLPQPDWPRLCARLDALLAGQTGMLAEPDAVETLAQRFAARLIAAQMHPTPSAAVPKPPPAPEPAQPAPSAASTAPDAVYAEVDSLPLRRRGSPRCNSPDPAPSASKPPVSPPWSGWESIRFSPGSDSMVSSAMPRLAC